MDNIWLIISGLLFFVVLVQISLIAKLKKQLTENDHQFQSQRQQQKAQFEQQLLQQQASFEQQQLQQKADFDLQLQDKIKQAQKRSNNAQRSVLKGQIAEQFTPFLAGFEYNPSDCQFLGQPIDYVIFNNLHQCADNQVPIEAVEVIFAEVKTGRAKPNIRQQILQQAIANGQVRFEVLRIHQDDDGVMVGREG